LNEDSHAKLEIYNISGQRLAILFDGDVKAADMQKVEYIAGDVSGGVIIYRLQTEYGTWYDKAVMVR